MNFRSSPVDFAHEVLVFVHVPKTAGSAFLQAFDERFGPNERLETRMEKVDRIYLSSFAARSFRAEQSFKNGMSELFGIERLLPRGSKRSMLQQIKLLSGHVTLGNEPKTGRLPLYLTLVRDPIERFISHYYYLHDLAQPEQRRRERQAARIYGLEDYVNRLASGALIGPTNVHCLFLAGNESFEAARRVVDEKVFLAAPSERLDEFLALLSMSCGVGPITASRSNVGAARQTAERPSPATIDKIRTLVGEDLRLVDYVGSQFDHLVRAQADERASQRA